MKSNIQLILLPLASIALGSAVLIPLAEAAPVDLKRASARVDALIGQGYQKHGVKAYPVASDEIFVRRIYLDLIGRVPSQKEALEFLNAKDPEKRAKLIEALTHSEGYVSHHFNYWADILRVKSRLNGAGQSAPAGHSYIRWIQDAIRDNKPYDEMVYELIAAEGRSWENGAIGYYIRDYGMNLDNMAVTTQIFLGTSVACAQCHNHPFDKWTQMDFYQHAAYQWDVVTTNNSDNMTSAMSELSKGKKVTSQYRRDISKAFSEILKPLRFNNVYIRDRTLALPHDYQYADAKPKSGVTPAVLFGKEVKPAGDAQPLEAYAGWMASPDNPRFTTVIANRMWKKVMGLGLFEPVDEIMDHSDPSNPELLAFLEKTMVEFDYDLRKFMTMLYNTRTYQRESHREDVMPGVAYHYPGPLLKRMSAEQIWDSLVTLIADDPDTPNPYAEMDAEKSITRTRWIAESVYDQSPREFLEGAKKIAATQKKLSREMREIQEKREAALEAGDVALSKKLASEGSRKSRDLVRVVESTVYQKGFADKVQLVAAKDYKADEVSDEFLEELAGCIADEDLMKRAGGSNSPMTEVVKAVLQEQESQLKRWAEKRREEQWKEWGVDDAGEKKAWYDYNNLFRSTVMRASDLPQPSPPGHFLREFGQSDREVIHNANSDASITQALNLLNNSQLHGALRNPYTVLNRSLAKVKTPAQKIDAIYLALLSRRSSAEEKNILLPLLKENPGSGAFDAAWTVLNTRQFLFIQ